MPKDKGQSFDWDVFSYAAYSPDLALSDFPAFPGLYNFLLGQWFHDEESLSKDVT